ncbi:MAG: REP-associated tyrosine transposase [Panacagrimonas sp.]
MLPPNQKPGHRALRKGRVSIPGQVYHVTTATADRHNWFTDLALARVVARALNAPELLGDSRTLCWLLMPDHLHWLVQLGELATLPQLVARVKQATASRINLRLQRLGAPVWAPSFHDHALRRDEDVETVARYIVGNPIRAGLCASEREYSHWDCAWEWDW